MTQANQNEKLIPVFQDEVHFQVQTTITRKWAEKGSEPKVMSKPGKNNVAYSGFVIPETGELTVTKPGWFNYESVIQSFREFIKTKPCPDGKKYCIILDNAPWHKKAIRLIWTEALAEYSDIRENMEYISLPPYSPDLNPIEQVWRITRREKTHNRYFSSLESLIKAAEEMGKNQRIQQEANHLISFSGFFNPNKQLRNLCGFSCFA